MELCIGIQAALACLAILSRIHFSKYKDGDIKGLKHIREEVQALRVLTRREAQTLVQPLQSCLQVLVSRRDYCLKACSSQKEWTHKL